VRKNSSQGVQALLPDSEKSQLRRQLLYINLDITWVQLDLWMIKKTDLHSFILVSIKHITAL
jgi:hypothetical protein